MSPCRQADGGSAPNPKNRAGPPFSAPLREVTPQKVGAGTPQTARQPSLFCRVVIEFVDTQTQKRARRLAQQ